MKTTLLLLPATLATAGTISTPSDPRDALTTSGFPTWGVTCMTSAVSAVGCAPNDVSCLCNNNDPFIAAAKECVVSACGTATGTPSVQIVPGTVVMPPFPDEGA